jgi:uncharacterized protein (UPF0335 family)
MSDRSRQGSRRARSGEAKREEGRRIGLAFKSRRDPRQAEAFSIAETGEAIAAGQLRSLVERIERLEEDRTRFADDIKLVYAEAKAEGFHTKVLRKVIALRRRPPDEREVEQGIMELYLQALGMER